MRKWRAQPHARVGEQGVALSSEEGVGSKPFEVEKLPSDDLYSAEVSHVPERRVVETVELMSVY